MQPVSTALPDTPHIVLDSNLFRYLVFVEELNAYLCMDCLAICTSFQFRNMVYTPHVCQYAVIPAAHGQVI
jgi:hypothetical protein